MQNVDNRIDVEVIVIVVKHQATLIALLPSSHCCFRRSENLPVVAAVFHNNAFRTLAVIARRVVDPFVLAQLAAHSTMQGQKYWRILA